MVSGEDCLFTLRNQMWLAGKSPISQIIFHLETETSI